MSEGEVETVDQYGRGKDNLTPRQRLFVMEYPVDWNATQAAIRAGYSVKSAADIGSENLQKPAIIEALTRHMAGREEKAGVDRAWVLARLVNTEAEAAQAIEDGKANKGLGVATARAHRLRALELIGKHVDVAAFRSQFGGDAGGDHGRLWDLSKLDDEELDTFERLLAKISVAGDGSVRADDPATAPGEGAHVSEP